MQYNPRIAQKEMNMTQETLRSNGFNCSHELATYLLEFARLHDNAPMYVKDENGNEFNCVEVTETTLTDGSKVVDVLLRVK